MVKLEIITIVLITSVVLFLAPTLASADAAIITPQAEKAKPKANPTVKQLTSKQVSKTKDLFGCHGPILAYYDVKGVLHTGCIVDYPVKYKEADFVIADTCSFLMNSILAEKGLSYTKDGKLVSKSTSTSKSSSSSSSSSDNKNKNKNVNKNVNINENKNINKNTNMNTNTNINNNTNTNNNNNNNNNTNPNTNPSNGAMNHTDPNNDQPPLDPENNVTIPYDLNNLPYASELYNITEPNTSDEPIDNSTDPTIIPTDDIEGDGRDNITLPENEPVTPPAETDTNNNGIPDVEEPGAFEDDNGNGIPDGEEMTLGDDVRTTDFIDENENGIDDRDEENPALGPGAEYIDLEGNLIRYNDAGEPEVIKTAEELAAETEDGRTAEFIDENGNMIDDRDETTGDIPWNEDLNGNGVPDHLETETETELCDDGFGNMIPCDEVVSATEEEPPVTDGLVTEDTYTGEPIETSEDLGVEEEPVEEEEEQPEEDDSGDEDSEEDSEDSEE